MAIEVRSEPIQRLPEINELQDGYCHERLLDTRTTTQSNGQNVHIHMYMPYVIYIYTDMCIYIGHIHTCTYIWYPPMHLHFLVSASK